MSLGMESRERGFQVMVSRVFEGPPVMVPSRSAIWLKGWRRFAANRAALLGLLWLILFGVVAVWGRQLAPYSMQYANLFAGNEGPSLLHPFGTDSLGQDMLTMVMYGLRYTLAVGFGATVVALVVGVFIGLTSGMAGRLLDEGLMRLTDFVYAFPGFLFAAFIVGAFHGQTEVVILAFGLTQWAGFARLTRGLVLTVRHSELVESGRAIGASRAFIALRYILPQVVNSIIVYTAFVAVNIITLQAELSLFYGTGPALPLISFGQLISQGTADVLGYWWLLVLPVGTLISLLVALVVVGEGLQAALNPKGNRIL